jgi:hypothetical protein
MRKTTLNIIDFVTRMNLVEPEGPALGHRTFLKTFYGLELDEEELEFYRRATGRTNYLPREHKEVTAIVGRRGGKTTLASEIAIYEAIQYPKLPRGARAYVIIVAPSLSQAQIAFDYIREGFNGSPTLKEFIDKPLTDEIRLRTGITIACYPCSYIAVRGISVVCAICDELAFWNHEETSANPENEVMAALRPAMATFRNAKLIKISTPFRKEGILWNDFQERNNRQHLVWHASTQEMNPTISTDFFEEERHQHGDEYYKREYLAEFTDNIAGWMPRELLDRAIVRGQKEFPPVRGGTYVAAADPGFMKSDFGFAVLHRSDDGHITVVYARRWTGTREIPVDPEAVTREISEFLQRHGINTLVGDQHCYPVLRDYFQKLGITYREFSFGTYTRASIFGNLGQLLGQQKITFVDEPELLRQFRSLERINLPNGNTDIRPPRSSKDDMAIAVALAAFELSRLPECPGSFSLGLPKPPISRLWRTDVLDYWGMPMPTCSKYPGCFEAGATCECMP